jgi:hypothetical protein
MKQRMSSLILLLLFCTSCAPVRTPTEQPPEESRYHRLQALIDRIESPNFYPVEGERTYPFTFVFRKAKQREVVRQGQGFVLITGSLWCLVQHWQDLNTGNPGHRMLIVDRSQRRFEAEVRSWPEGHSKQRYNQWTCIRFSDPAKNDSPLYSCEYFYPEGIERVIHDPQKWLFYSGFSWNDDGLLERMTRFSNSSARYLYDGLKLKRIEFIANGSVVTTTEFSYQ